MARLTAAEAKARRRAARAGKRGGAPAAPAPSAPRDSRAVLFPGAREVKLLDGTLVQVRPWSIETLCEISQRLPETLQRIIESATSDSEPAAALIPAASSELVYIVARSTGWDANAVQQWAAVDLLTVSLTVFEVCLEPIAAKIGSLGKKLGGMVPQALMAIPIRMATPAPTSPEPSTS